MPEKMDLYVIDLNTQPGTGIKIKFKKREIESKKRKLSSEPSLSPMSYMFAAGSGSDMSDQSNSSVDRLTPSPPPLIEYQSSILPVPSAPSPISEDKISHHSDTSSSMGFCPTLDIPMNLSSQNVIQLVDSNGIETFEQSPYRSSKKKSKRRRSTKQLSMSSRISTPPSIVDTAHCDEEDLEDEPYSKEVEDSVIEKQDSSEGLKYGDMPKLSPRPPINSQNSEVLQRSETNPSPVMPVLSPQSAIQETDNQVLCARTLFNDSDSPGMSIRSTSTDASCNDNESAQLTDDGPLPETGSPSSETATKKAARPKKLGNTKCPPPGQVSLRGYYYGRWNWGEDIRRGLAPNKKKQNKKWHFEAEFWKPIWKVEMDTPVLCPSCPATINKNTDIVTHMMEHIKIGDSGTWQISKCESNVPKLVSLINQCRVCFSKCPSLLTSHMRHAHQHVTDICCRICEIEFDTVESMSRHHSKFHHVAEMPFACPVCECRSSVRWDIVQHFQSKHGKEQNAMCPICTKLFDVSITLGMQTLQHHLLAHKAEPEIKCPRCCLKFVEIDDFDIHLFHHHHPPEGMDGSMFHDPETGFQCFKEEDKRVPIFITHPKRIALTDAQTIS